MSRRPILMRLVLPFGGMIVALVAVCGTLVYLASQQAAREQQIHELSRMTALVRESIPAPASTIDSTATARLKELSNLLGTRVTLIDGGGKVFFDSLADASTMENHNSRPEIVDARRAGDGSAVRFSHTISEQAVYVAQPLNANDPNGVIVRLSYPRHTWSTLAVPAWVIVISAIVLSAIVVLAMAALLQRDWIGPVRSLSNAAHRMASGEWQTRAAAVGHDEIRAFSTDLNFLAGEAEKQLADLNAEREQLRVLVDLLPDPIFLTDAKQRVALINSPAARLLNFTPGEALGRPLVNVLNESSLIALFEQAQQSPGDQVEPREVRLIRHGQRMIFQAVALRPPSGKGVLLLLRDVTAMAGAVQMKTDFVANAGHELRTPIHAIKLAFETLHDVYQDDPEQATKCFDIASGHLKRLEELLADLLDLSRVESADAEVQHASVSVEELFGTTRAALSTMSRQKVVELAFETTDNAPKILHSDRRLLQLILRNLVENAIKFTSTGGRVSITLSRDQNEAVLRVTDNGIGIPPEHLERVFERFYQVETSRAGTVGRGTGLGLAIVKHAVHALDGSVRLESEMGKGTTVECRIPVIETSVSAV